MTLSTHAHRLSWPGVGSLAFVAALAGLTATATAQQTGSLPAPPADKTEAFRKNVTLLGIPPATVAPDGLVFASLAWTDKRRGIYDDEDGSAALGFGIGVGDDLFDLQFTAHITSLEDDFADSGYLDVRASKRVDSGNTPTFVGVGFGDLAEWGDSDDGDDTVNFYASLTSFPVLELGGGLYPLMLTVGGGNKVRNFGADTGVFAGAGIGLTESFGASVAYNGDNVDVGASFRIPGVDSLGFNAILGDAFDQDDRQRVILSINWISDNVF